MKIKPIEAFSYLPYIYYQLVHTY